MTEAPLAGIRVLDLTRVVAGPYGTGLLADFGARVVKVEEPKHGDECRILPDKVRGLSLTFSDLNRNKQSLALDLTQERGREILLRLLPHFDVLVENYRAGKYDHGDRSKVGALANSAKLRAGEASFRACDRALQTFGGFGYAKEFHVERYWRKARLMRIAPISQEMVLNFLSEHVLGLPRSY